MPTLWQILTGQYKKEDVESKFYNPLNLRIGNRVGIDTLDLESVDFSVQALKQVTRHVGNEKFLMADYSLVARPFGQDVIQKRLRLVPLDEHGEGKTTHSAVLFNLLAEFKYDEDFHNGLGVNTEITEGEATPEQPDPPKYWRVNDVNTPWECTIKHISDVDGDGRAEMSEVKDAAMTYWDFWRETPDEGGNKVIEFYIVEMNNDNGWFQVWVGREIDQHRIEVH